MNDKYIVFGFDFNPKAMRWTVTELADNHDAALKRVREIWEEQQTHATRWRYNKDYGRYNYIHEYENDIWAFSKLVKSHDTTSIIRALPCGGSCTDHVVITACKSGCTSAKLGIAFKCWLYQSAFTGVLHDMASIAEEMFDPEVVIGKNEMKVFDTSYFDEHYYRIVEVS